MEPNVLMEMTADLSRNEARQPLRFPDRTIVTIPHNPLQDAIDEVREAAHDFTFAIAEAYNAKDVTGLAEIQGHLSACIEALQVVESMASDFERRMR